MQAHIRALFAAFGALAGAVLIAGAAFAATTVETKTYNVTIGCDGAVFTPNLPRDSGSYGRTTPTSTNPAVVSATGGRAGMGTNGAITLNGNSSGTATVNYAVENDSGSYQQIIIINVTVDCPPRAHHPGGGGAPRPPGPGPGGGPPGNGVPGGQGAGVPPPGGGLPSFTHRVTNCPACRALANQLNAVVDQYSNLQDIYNQQMANPRTRGMAAGTMTQLQALLAQIHALAQALNDCERNCPPPQQSGETTGSPPGNPETPKPGGSGGTSGDGTGGTSTGGTSTGGTSTGGTSTGGTGRTDRGGSSGAGGRTESGSLGGNVRESEPCPPEKRPIIVGPNNRVGSSARARQRATNAVLGALSNLAGGGGGGGGGSSGPDLVRCHLGDRESTVFSDPASGVSLRVGARRGRNGVEVYAGVETSPDNGTFQTAFLQNAAGAEQAPRDVGVCGLWGSWSLSVSWTRTTYENGQVINRESGGWERAGQFAIPGVVSTSDRPDGLWRRLGFSNASHGARQIAMQYQVTPADLAAGPVQVVIHVTRPSGDPVTTVPFVLLMTEGPRGFTFTRAPSDCPPDRAEAGSRVPAG